VYLSGLHAKSTCYGLLIQSKGFVSLASREKCRGGRIFKHSCGYLTVKRNTDLTFTAYRRDVRRCGVADAASSVVGAIMSRPQRPCGEGLGEGLGEVFVCSSSSWRACGGGRSGTHSAIRTPVVSHECEMPSCPWLQKSPTVRRTSQFLIERVVQKRGKIVRVEFKRLSKVPNYGPWKELFEGGLAARSDKVFLRVHQISWLETHS